MSNLLGFPISQILAGGPRGAEASIAFDATNWVSRVVLSAAALALLVATGGFLYATFSRTHHHRLRLISILLFIAGLLAAIISAVYWSTPVVD